MPKKCHRFESRNYYIASIMIWCAAALSGCANQTTLSGEAAATRQLTEADIKQYLEEWQAAKPGIARLTELESDLTFLIAEVSKMSQLSQTPEKYAQASEISDSTDSNVIVATATAPFQAEPVTPVAITQSEPPSESGLTSAIYAVHVAHFLKPASANFGWYVVQQEYPVLMQHLTPKLKYQSRHNQQLYSLRIGPFVSDAQADKACSLLKRRNYRCELTTFDGIELQL